MNSWVKIRNANVDVKCTRSYFFFACWKKVPNNTTINFDKADKPKNCVMKASCTNPAKKAKIIAVLLGSFKLIIRTKIRTKSGVVFNTAKR